MSTIWSKEVFAENLQMYIERSGKDRREIADALGFPYSTMTDWLNAKKYPRIDKIEMLANYFGILKSDLIEEKLTSSEEKENDTIADVTYRMETNKEFFDTVERLMYDKEFFEVVKLLGNLKKEKFDAVKQLL